MTDDRCSSCGRRPLLWSSGRLVCPNPQCATGHQQEDQLPLIPCLTEACTARIDVASMPGGLCGECFRRLPEQRKRYAIRQQRDPRDGRTRHSVKR